MKLKRLLFTSASAITLMTANAAMACEVDDVDLANLRASNLTKISEHLDLPPHLALGSHFVQDLKQCSYIRIITLRSKSSGQIYTAIASNEDSCDGGNTFGYVVKGTTIQTNSVIAMIQDSYIQCL